MVMDNIKFYAKDYFWQILDKYLVPAVELCTTTQNKTKQNKKPPQSSFLPLLLT